MTSWQNEKVGEPGPLSATQKGEKSLEILLTKVKQNETNGNRKNTGLVVGRGDKGRLQEEVSWSQGAGEGRTGQGFTSTAGATAPPGAEQ